MVSVIAFNENSSAICGFKISTIKLSKFVQQQYMPHILLSAETHNFPSCVAPFPGDETVMGANLTASMMGYSVGALNIPRYELPWDRVE